MYALALNERDHYAIIDMATTSVRDLPKKYEMPSIVSYMRAGTRDRSIVFTWNKAHRTACHALTKDQGCCFAPKEVHALARAAEESIDKEHVHKWIAQKRDVREGSMWILDEKHALATKPRVSVGSTLVPRVMCERGLAWPAHVSDGITLGGLLSYFGLVPYLCVFQDEPMRVLPDPV
jgi:hypothetical protein